MFIHIGGDEVRQWLKSIQLDIYADRFAANGFDTLLACSKLNDKILKDDLNVSLMGHRVGVLQAVKNLGGILYSILFAYSICYIGFALFYSISMKVLFYSVPAAEYSLARGFSSLLVNKHVRLNHFVSIKSHY